MSCQCSVRGSDSCNISVTIRRSTDLPHPPGRGQGQGRSCGHTANICCQVSEHPRCPASAQSGVLTPATSGLLYIDEETVLIPQEGIRGNVGHVVILQTPAARSLSIPDVLPVLSQGF